MDFPTLRARKCLEILHIHAHWNARYCCLHNTRGQPINCDCPKNSYHLPTPPEYRNLFIQFLIDHNEFTLGELSDIELDLVMSEMETRIREAKESVEEWKPMEGEDKLDEYVEILEKVKKEKHQVEKEVMSRRHMKRRGFC
ncbi:hypothetical protein GCK72_016621 [Caenorhabditis remanei]|uniref:Uncharacterized protein n=1 Tax=Caenorhabditis remanei TaxID=31234 RepID=A0A6A5G5X9_CAERE|nr:hypothetical protein GCK72_016621 [Caenorhabditis remanei]KAF1750075.1 hypothetical protein GCK72_016621 [Caenorhabditis remanei]